MCEVLLSSLCFERLSLVLDDWGRAGRPPALLSTLMVRSGPKQSCLLSLLFWICSDECFYLHDCFLQWESPFIIRASKCYHPNGDNNSMYLGSSQNTQQMWLSEAIAIYLLSVLEWILHSSQRNLGFLLTCWMRLYHRSSWAPCSGRSISGNRDAPYRWARGRYRA